jgi:hypothetical protein
MATAANGAKWQKLGAMPSVKPPTKKGILAQPHRIF